MSDTVVHAVGIDVTFNGRRRQRCAWCGALLVDDDFTRMSWPLAEDGTDPGPPAPLAAGELYEVAGGLREGFRGLSLIDPDTLERTADGEGLVVPANACLHLDPEVTS